MSGNTSGHPVRRRAAVVLTCATLLAGCAGQESDDRTADEAETDTPHGYVEGAEETAEAQPRLVIADAETGEVSVLDLITEELRPMDDVPDVEGASGDGRFVYLTAGEEVHVVDGASWMVDHGDHVHYYRAEARGLGSVTGTPPADVHSDSAITAFSFNDGRTELFDRDAMESTGELAALDVDTSHTVGSGDPGRVTVPYAGHLLALAKATDEAGGSTDDAVRVLDRAGAPVTEIDAPCPDAGEQRLTRYGLVVGCEDGALLISEQDGTFSADRIPYPASGAGSDAAPAREFTMRAGGDTLAAPAGDSGVWVLDLSEREWSYLDTGPVVAVNAVGSGPMVLTLTPDGVLRSHDHVSGAETASVPLLERVPEGDDAAPPVVLVDNTRAYVSDPGTRQVHEVDYQDDLRVARTLDVPLRPDYVVETGR